MNRKLLRWLVVLASIPALAFATALLVGSRLPEAHLAVSTAEFRAPADSVWAVISDIGAGAAWRPEVDKVERGADQNGNPVWVETGPTGSLPYEVVALEPPRRMVTRIADPDLPFGGTWTYTVEPLPAGAQLTLEERGEIYHPLFRVFARFVFGYHSSMDGYLTAVGERLGETVTPRHLDAPAS